MIACNVSLLRVSGIAAAAAVVALIGGGMLTSTTSASYQDQVYARSKPISVMQQEEPLDPKVPPVYQVGLSTQARMVDTGLGMGNDGNVYVWGRTDMQIGGDTTNQGSPRPPQRVPGIPQGTARQVTGGIYNINALTADGTVWGWGTYAGRDGTMNSKPNGNPKQLRIGTPWDGTGPLLDNVVTISSTEQAGAAIRNDGTVWHWGVDTGYGGGTLPGASQLLGLPDPTIAGNRPVYLKGAYTNFFVILENGDVYYWGGAGGNSLPLGSANVSQTPAKVSALSPWTRKNVASDTPYIVAVDGGINMGGAILSDGSVLSWGTDGSRIGGRISATPRVPGLVPGLSNIESMQFGFTGAAFLTRSADLWGYGASDDYGAFPQQPKLIDSRVLQYASGQGYYIWQTADLVFHGRGYNPQGAIGLPATSTASNRIVSFDLGILTKP